MLREDFSYNGRRLSDWNMKMYDAEQSAQWVGRVIDKGSMNALRDIPSHFTTHYEDVLKHYFLIIRDPDVFDDVQGLRLTDKDIHKLRSWLEYPRTPMELVLTEDDEEIQTCYFGLFTDAQPFVVNERCYGLKLTFTCNAPYGFSPETSKRYTIPNSMSLLDADFLNQSVAFGRMLAPTVVIKPKTGVLNGGTVTIRNLSEPDGMRVNLPVATDNCVEMTIDCSKKIVTAVQRVSGQQDTVKLLRLSALNAEENEDYFGDISVTQSVIWLTMHEGNNNLRFETEDVVQDLTIDLRTRYIVKAGGV